MSNIVKGSGVLYTTGIPNTIPNINFDAEFAIDVTNGFNYAWNRTTNVWDNVGQGIEILSTAGEPPHEPSGFEPRFALSSDRQLYFFTKPRSGPGVWNKIISTPFKTILIALEHLGSNPPALTVYLDETNSEFPFVVENPSVGTYLILNEDTAPFTPPCVVNCTQLVSDGDAFYVTGRRLFDEQIQINSYDVNGGLTSLENDPPLLIEIRVYNV